MFPLPGPGRTPGSKNKSTLEAREIMDRLGFNPIEELISRYKDPKLQEQTHNLMLRELVARFAPVLRSVELTGQDGEALQSLIRVIYQSDNKSDDHDNLLVSSD